MKQPDRSENDIRKDADEIRASLPEMHLPESLSAESVTDLVSGVEQKKPKKKIVRRILAGAVAACLVVTGLFVLDAAVYAPVINPKEGEIEYAQDYSELLSIIKDYRKSENFKNRTSTMNGAKMMDQAQTVVDADGVGVPESARASAYADAKNGSSYSRTNTRVEGIGEADIVKTDGKNLYIVKGSTVYIVTLGSDGKPEKTAKISPLDTLADKDEKGELVDDIDSGFGVYRSRCVFVTNYVRGIYVYGSTLVVELCCVRNKKIQTGIAVYDIGDISAPKVKRVFMQDGSLISSRVTGNSIILVSNSVIYSETIDDGIIPRVSSGENGSDMKDEMVRSGDIAVANAANPEGFLIVSKTNLDTLESKPEATALLGGGSDIYCTDSTVYVATECCDTKSEKTNTKLTSFDITGEKPQLKASGAVEGTMLDTFSMDEYNGYIRVAVTRSGDNCVYVLDTDMKKVGALENIAPGETVRAVRFSGSTGYVVTFLQTDPLFVIDLSSPESPAIKGEVKLPGFSSYLHPAGKNLLLGVGVGGTEEGTDGSAKLSLFDVSDPSAPKEVDSFVMKNTDFNTEYKAFIEDSDPNTYLIPFNCWRYSQNEYEDNILSTDAKRSTGVVRIAVENGKLVQKNIYEVTSIDDNGAAQFTRAAFVNNTLYGIDCYGLTGKIISFNKTTGETLGEFVFEKAAADE